MKTTIKALLSRLQPAIAWFKRYAAFLAVVAFLMTYLFLVYRVNQLVQSEPSASANNEGYKTIQRLKIDEAAVDKIEQLQQQNVQVQTLFKQARDNPFNE